MSENLPPPVINSWCRTKGGEEEKFTFAWTIEKFSERQEQNGQSLCSSKFTISGPNDMETHWKLKVFPKGNKKECKEFLSIFLVNETEANVTAKSRFYILGSSNSIQDRIPFHSDSVHMFDSTSDWGFSQFLKLTTIKDESSELLPNGNLTLVCDVTVLGPNTTEAEPSTLPKPCQKVKLEEDFLKI